jgi:hypothetical protein
MAARPTMMNPLFNDVALPAATICHGFARGRVFRLFSLHFRALSCPF